MLLWPEQTQTSPNSTSVNTSVTPSEVAVTLWLANDAAVAGSNTRQVVKLPSAWSGPMVAAKARPSSVTVTVASGGQKPQTIARFGAAARTIPELKMLANRNAAVEGG